ncbi:MAG: 7-cyano-7-deazaguanine synthase [Nanoarchaeota archaeon]
MKNAIILCSGGLDSVVTAYYVKNRLNYDNLIILFFNYSQKSILKEREFSKKCAKDLNARFIEIDLKWLGKISNSLVNKLGKVKKISKNSLKNTKKESENFYVPFRNTIFISYAIALAESIFFKEKMKYNIFLGFKNEGKESFPDTTIKYVNEVNRLSKIATAGFKILTPLIKKDKEDIIILGNKLGVDFRKTYSCYIGKRFHCGTCLACKLRQAGFYWANISDPTKYKNQ